MHHLLAAAHARVLLADGAVGTELHRLGVPVGVNLERINLTRPDLVTRVHRSYLEAGARLLETNTFGANPIRLGRAGLKDEMEAINRAAVRCARTAREGGDALIAGAIGPLGPALAPVGNLARDGAEKAFSAQAAVLAMEGVDLILLETFADLDEMVIAARAALGTGLPVIASLAFDAEGFTPTGLSAHAAGKVLAELPLCGIGANCGAGPEGISRAAAQLAPHLRPDQLLCLMPNAGLPQRLEGRTVFRTDPGYFAAAAAHLRETGANIIGGCCGSGPAHIQALARVVSGRPVLPRRAEASTPADARGEPVRAPSPFLAKLGREFVRTVELSPPKGADPTPSIEAARALKRAGADAVNVADGPMARVRMSSVALAHRLQEDAGLETVLHLTCRDRNIIGLQADLLGASALGIRNILALTGDPPQVGDHPQATAVFDVNAAGLVKIAAGLNHGADLAGNTLGRATGFAIGVAVNPAAADLQVELQRLRDKIEAGADFCLTQPVFAPAAAEAFLNEAARFGRPVLIGLWPLQSLRQADYLAHEVPGMAIPAEILARIRACAPEVQSELGLAIAAEVLTALRPLCAGVCLMPGGDMTLALRLLQRIEA